MNTVAPPSVSANPDKNHISFSLDFAVDLVLGCGFFFSLRSGFHFAVVSLARSDFQFAADL
ncbi:hypothetical protein L195_g049359, partial [Trifolium pratense]